MTSPAAPTLHPKRCETCECESCYFHPSKKEWREGMTDGMDMCPIKISTFTERYGCYSHSSTPDADARQRVDELIVEKEQWMNNFLCEQQRVEGVVKELERRLAQSKRLRTYFTSEECARTDGYESGLESAIALLKDGVGRK